MGTVQAALIALMLLIGWQPPVAPRVYDLVADSSENINAAIDRGVDGMNFIARPIARRRLRATNPTPEHLAIESRPDTMVVTLGENAPLHLARDGGWTPWRNLEGDDCKTSATFLGDTLIEHLIARGGRKETRYVFADRGRRVHLSIKITSSHLSAPVEYTLVFAAP